MKMLTLYHSYNKIAEHSLQDNQEIIIGRGKDCNISIEDSLISRKHLRIFFENDHWNIECLSRFGQLKTADGHAFSTKTIDKNSDFEFWIAHYRIHISKASAIQEDDQNNTSLMVLPDQEQKDDISDDHLESFDANISNSEDSGLIPLEDIDNKSLSNVISTRYITSYAR